MKILKNFKEINGLIPVIVYQEFKDENIVVVNNNNLFISLQILKSHIGYQYNLLSCISGIDLLGKDYRFSVAYDLLSLTYNSRIRVKIFIDEITFVPSAVKIFINSNWWEREIWDLYGIYFDKHPDLRRILTDYGFEGHPMRKDFPLYGYVELRYDESKKRIVVEPLELTQEFRSFTFETPW
jgi:NADH dehydrogenase (ubiquinone) Fe-S protein 3